MNDYYLVRVVLHKCKICHQRLFCDLGTIKGHVKRYHKINNFKEYKDMPYQDFTRTKGTGEQDEDNLDMSYEIQSWENALEKAPVSENVANLCTYKCKTCQRIFKTRRSLSRHLQTTLHTKTTSTNHKNFYSCRKFYKKNYLINIIVHKCNVCYQRITCSKTILLTHLISNSQIKNLKFYVDLPRKTSSKAKLKEITDNSNVKKRIQDAYYFAPVSQEIGSLCIFTCNICSISYNTRGGLWVHLRASGHGDPAKTMKFVTKIVMHQCRICLKKVLCDTETIKRHLKTHNVNSIEDYVVSKSVNWALGKLPEHQIELERFYKTEATRYECTRLVKSMCKFMCNKCDYISLTWDSMKNHVSSKEHGPLSVVTTYFQKVVLHKCHICNKIILCDAYFISTHLQKHKLSMGAYKNKFSPSTSRVELEKNYLSRLSAIIKDISIIKTQKKIVMETSLASGNQVTKHVGNASSMQCPFCKKSYLSFDSLRAHCKAQHKDKKFKYDIRQVTGARYHKCHICDILVLCDNAIIRAHAWSRHKMKYCHYIKYHVLKNGGKVIPTLQDFQHNIKIFDTFKIDTEEDDLNYEENGDNGLIQPHMLSSESEDSDDACK